MAALAAALIGAQIGGAIMKGLGGWHETKTQVQGYKSWAKTAEQDAEAVERAQRHAPGVVFSADLAPCVLNGAPDRLARAVNNLLDNAVKYSDDGSSVTVYVTRVGDWVDIAVADRGIGIPTRDLDRIFERFYRVDRARSRETGGTGLGLAIVRHVANNHGGEVRVESHEGEGSVFTLRIPACTDS